MKRYARIVTPGETLLPGDLFFQYGTSWAARLIQFYSHASHNHVGVIIRGTSKPGVYWVVEANSKGVVRTKRTIPSGYVVRMPEYLGVEIAHASRDLASLGIEYDWLAVGLWYPGMFFRRSRLTRWLGRAMCSVAEKHVAKKDRMICSEAVYMVLREFPEFDELLEPLAHRSPYTIAPFELLRVILGHRDEH